MISDRYYRPQYLATTFKIYLGLLYKITRFVILIELAERKRNSVVLHGRVYGVDHGAVHHNLKERCAAVVVMS